MSAEAEEGPAIRRVLQDTSLFLIGNLAGRVVGFLAIPFYAAYLTPAEYGIAELVEVSTQTVAILLGLQGIGVALSRVYHDQAGEAERRRVVSTALTALLLFSAAVMSLAVLAAPLLSQLAFRSAEWAGLLRAAFVAMFFGEIVEVAMVYERIRDRARLYFNYMLASLFAMLALNVLFIGFLGYGVWGFILSKLLVTGVSAAWLLVRVYREVGAAWHAPYVTAFARFSAPLVLSGLSFFLIHFSDRFFLTGAVSLAELGRYALAYRFAFLISALVGDSFNKSWHVTIYRYANRPGWQRQFALVASYLTFVLFMTGMVVALFAPEVLRVMVPTDYLPPPLLLPMLVAAYLLREFGDFFSVLLLINRRTLTAGRVAAAMAALNIAANLVLIPSLGVFGAAWSTVLTWGVYAAVCWAIAHREHALPVHVPAYARLWLLAGGLYALAAATRSGPVPVQLLVDGAWLLLFAVLAFFLFFGREERHGALGLVGTGLLWLVGRDAAPALPEGVAPEVLAVGAPGAVAAAAAAESFAVGLLSGAPPQPGASAWALRLGGVAATGTERLLGGEPGWLPAAFRGAAGRLHRNAVLVSAPPPEAAHLLALSLKRRHGLPWIAELAPSGRGGLRRRVVDPQLERAVVAQADAVLAPPERAAALRSRFPDAAGRIHDLPGEGAPPGALLALLDAVRRA